MIDVPAFKQLLADVVRDVVREELARALAAQRPLSKAELAAALGTSTTTVDRRVRNGMPYTKEGPHRVFDLDACRAWLRDRPAPEEVGDVLDVVKKKSRRAA